MHKQVQLSQQWQHVSWTSMTAARLVPRWLRLVGMLALMFAIASTSNPVLAYPNFDYTMKLQFHVITPPAPICAHSNYPIRVSLGYTLIDPKNKLPKWLMSH